MRDASRVEMRPFNDSDPLAPKIWLLLSQGDNRIHACCSPRWKIARGHGHRAERERHGPKGQRVGRTDVVQQRRQHAGQSDCTRDASNEAHTDDAQCLANHHRGHGGLTSAKPEKTPSSVMLNRRWATLWLKYASSGFGSANG